MRSLIWKEMRELALCACLAALALALAEGFTLYTLIGSMEVYNPSGVQSTIDSGYGYFKLWMQVGAPVVALLFGIIQVVPEQRREQWAFLIHRPLTRRQIFVAKSSVGIGMYLCATILPLLACTVWISAPGHFPGPFTPILALPDLAAIFAGIPFYFAASLVAMRPARWWGSKLLPVACAAAGMLMSSVMPTLGGSLVTAVGFVAAMAIAALGAFCTDGEYDCLGIAKRFALGAILLVGASATAITIFACGASMFPPRLAITVPSFALDRQGRLVQLEFGRNGLVTRVWDSAGRPLQHASIYAQAYDFWNNAAIHLNQTVDGPGPYSSYGRHFEIVGSTGTSMAHFDMYDFDRGVIDVYSLEDHRQVGFLGVRNVLTQEYLSAGRFPSRMIATTTDNGLTPNTWLVFPSEIFKFDSQTQAVTPFASSPPAMAFTGMSTALDLGGRHTYVLAASGAARWLYDSTGRVSATFRVEPLPSDYGQELLWLRLQDGIVRVLYESRIAAPASYYRQHPWHFVTYSLAGAKLSDLLVYPKTDAIDSGVFGSSVWHVLQPAMWGIVVLAISSLLAILHLTDWSTVQGALSDPSLASDIAWIIVGGVISAGIVSALSRKYAWGRADTLKWMLAGAFLSWCGVLMLLAMVPFPIRVPCRSCLRKTKIARAACEHCGAALDRIDSDGTEIFEPIEIVDPRDLDVVAVN